MKFGYADPPYPHQAKKLYQCAEINHEILINSLELHYDGWALSTSSSALQEVLSVCPPGVRIASWVKPFCAFKPNVNPAYTWEPVIWKSPKKHTRQEDTVKDHCIESITLKRGLTGAKPEAFCMWLFALLGLELEDTFEDLFYGSGAVTRAYQKWKVTKSIRQVKFDAIEITA
jgi:hypothetical protein